MKFNQKLQEGIFLKRYKRFFADIEWAGQLVVAHVPNTGSLKSVNISGQRCLFSEAEDPKRKLKYTLQMIESPEGSWVGVNTSISNVVVKEMLERQVRYKNELGTYGHWAGFDEVRPEYKINDETRLDFALKKKNSDHWHFIEVKNVTYKENGVACFPDAVTERGQKHLRELMALMKKGHSAEIVFTIQRNDCGSFAPADQIDPEYGRLLREAYHLGLKITPVVVELGHDFADLSENQLQLKL
jgi:sugar fermentation stimulation protein A